MKILSAREKIVKLKGNPPVQCLKINEDSPRLLILRRERVLGVSAAGAPGKENGVDQNWEKLTIPGTLGKGPFLGRGGAYYKIHCGQTGKQPSFVEKKRKGSVP